MFSFEESIDRILPACLFCFKDDFITLLNEEFAQKTDNEYIYNTVYLPEYYCLYPSRENIKPGFSEFLDIKYEYLLINRLNNDVFCIDRHLYQYLKLFSQPQDYSFLTGLNVREGYDDYFTHLIHENILLISTPDEMVKDQVDMPFINKYNKLGYEVIRLLNKNEYNCSFVVQSLNGNRYILKQYYKRNDIPRNKSLRNEISIMDKLNHPDYFPQLIYYDLDALFYITEYIDGNSLLVYLSNNPNLSDKISIMKTIISMVSDLHENNILHGDLHLDQFRVTNHGTIKLLDLELTIDLDYNNNEVFDFAGGAFEYLEPEAISMNPFKLLDTNNKNKPAEVYRLGILLYTILYDESPYLELTWKDLYQSKITTTPTFYRKTKQKELIPFPWISLIRKCLNKNPQKRFSCAREIYDKILITNHKPSVL